jgi:hypothetical protein
VRAVERIRALPELRASPLPIGVARTGVGLATVLGAAETAHWLKGLHKPGILRIPRFEEVPVLPQSGVALFLGLWILAGIAFALGWHTRPTGILLIGFQVYVLLLDHQLYSNHLYLMTLLVLLLTLADSGAAFSLDSRRNEGAGLIPAWPVVLMRVLVSVVYGFAVFAKLNPFFLSGIVLRQNIRVPGVEHFPAQFFMFLAMTSLAAEAFLAYAFWRKRLRVFAFLVGMGFHVTILATMWVFPDLVTFALLMGSAYLAFFSSLGPAEPNPLPADGEKLALTV